MSIFKKAAIAAVSVMLTAGAVQAADSVRIGVSGDYPPFNELTSDGELVGFDVDIAKALCTEMQADCEFVLQDWDGMIPALIANKIDAVVASMSITPDRLKKVDFSKKYYNTGPAIAVLKDSELTGDNLEDLAGLAIGAQVSTTHADYAEQKIPDIDLRLYPTPDEYKLDLEAGRVDGVIDDIVVLSDWVKSEDGDCCRILTALTPDPEINGQGAGIAVKKGNTELADKFTAAIAAIRANGKYKEINDKYFDFDVYGGE